MFDDELFTVTSLTASINRAEFAPRRIGELGLFQAEGISTTSLRIESDGMQLGLVENKERGAPGQVVNADKRGTVTIGTCHLPTTAKILADEAQNVTEFGSDDTQTAMEKLVDARTLKMAKMLDVTHEYHRIGAIKGQVLDKDGSLLLDLFQTFGFEQKTVYFDLGNNNSAIDGHCLDVLELMEVGLGDLFFTGGRVLCGANFWKKFVTHKQTKEPYARYQDGARLRGDMREELPFGGLIFERYRGSVGGQPFIDPDEAYAVPLGADELFLTRFAPGDYADTVNTLGLPYYASAEPLPHKKGVSLEAQSNPATLNTRPHSCVRLMAGAKP